jgi:inner membrane protein
MDPLAHTLVGAALAECGLRKRSPLATATLILGANAPDIDIVAAFGGSDASLHFRRGHTHGVLAMVVLPLLLTAVMLGWDRWVRRRRHPDGAPANPRALLLLAALSCWSHPALDWLNTYGVRLLMPFDATWFYGDSLFIVDPWLWLLAATPVVLARSRGRLSLAAWVVLGSATTALVTLTGRVPLTAKLVWCAGVLAIVIARVSFSRARTRRVALACVGLASAHVGAMILVSRMARDEVSHWLTAQGLRPEILVASPEAANPLAREVIAKVGENYHFVRFSLVGERFEIARDRVAVGPRDEVVAAALADPRLRGLRGWLRLPAVRVEETVEGYVVTIRDVRYGNAGGLGERVVALDRDLRPR